MSWLISICVCTCLYVCACVVYAYVSTYECVHMHVNVLMHLCARTYTRTQPLVQQEPVGHATGQAGGSPAGQ